MMKKLSSVINLNELNYKFNQRSPNRIQSYSLNKIDTQNRGPTTFYRSVDKLIRPFKKFKMQFSE
jgi:hypothetical protein